MEYRSWYEIRKWMDSSQDEPLMAQASFPGAPARRQPDGADHRSALAWS